jgi:hypothetical protein
MEAASHHPTEDETAVQCYRRLVEEYDALLAEIDSLPSMDTPNPDAATQVQKHMDRKAVIDGKPETLYATKKK